MHSSVRVFSTINTASKNNRSKRSKNNRSKRSKSNLVIPKIEPIFFGYNIMATLVNQEIGLIYACDQSGTIGIITKYKPYGTLPWTTQKEDMKHFMKITKNSVVIMGKNTWLSIGRPLNNRYNIVVSTSLKESHYDISKSSPMTGLMFCKSPEHALEQAKKIASANIIYQNIYFIGGKSIYDFALEHVDVVYRTVIHCVFEEDQEDGEEDREEEDREEYKKVKFDILSNDNSVEIVDTNTFAADSDNEYSYTIMKLRKKVFIGLQVDQE